MKPANIACVVLASGQSQRFGASNKLRADLCGKPVLTHVLDAARAVGFGALFCVAKEASVGDINWVENINSERGQGHALRLGLQAALEKEWGFCAILLGDMPLVSASYVELMIDKVTINQSVVSVCESIRMPPSVFNRSAIELILENKSAAGASAVFDDINLVGIELDSDSAQDVDTPEDLVRVAQIMKTRKT